MKRCSLLLLLLVFAIMPVRADDPGLPGGDPDLPIDGGMYVLMFIALIYGWRSIRRMRV